jgi:hypothetical protein
MNESGFNISGKMTFQDCVWNLGGITETEHCYLYLDNGVFECYRTVTSSFNKDKLSFLYSTLTYNNLDILQLIFNNTKINANGYYFTFRGDTNILDSVCFILFCYF